MRVSHDKLNKLAHVIADTLAETDECEFHEGGVFGVASYSTGPEMKTNQESLERLLKFRERMSGEKLNLKLRKRFCIFITDNARGSLRLVNGCE